MTNDPVRRAAENRAKEMVQKGLSLFKERDWDGRAFELPGGLLSSIWEVVGTELAEALENAERYQTCMRLGFPVRNQSPASLDKLWTIDGRWYGGSATAAIDTARKNNDA
jgi:hypothetical protein